MTAAARASLERRAHVDAREGLRGEPLGGLIITRTARSEALIVRGTGSNNNPRLAQSGEGCCRHRASPPLFQALDGLLGKSQRTGRDGRR